MKYCIIEAATSGKGSSAVSLCALPAIGVRYRKEFKHVDDDPIADEREYGSGDIVEPGVYLDVDTGSVVQVQERDELPEGNRVVRYRRRFRRIQPEALDKARNASARQ